MEKESLIFSNKMADIYYNKELKIMISVYHGIVVYELFEEIVNIINNTAIKKGLNGSISDVTQLRGSYHRVLGYMEETGLPLLIANGYKVHAQIISDDIIMKNLTGKVEKIMTSLGINFKTFTNRKEGAEWLLKELSAE